MATKKQTITKKDVGCMCSIEWIDAEKEVGLIVSHSPLMVFAINRKCIAKNVSAEILQVSKMSLTAEDLIDYFGEPFEM